MKRFTLYTLLICFLSISIGCGQNKDSLSPSTATSIEDVHKRQQEFMFGWVKDPNHYLKDFPTTVLMSEIKDREKELGVASESYKISDLAGGYDPQKLLANYPELKSYFTRFLSTPINLVPPSQLMTVQTTSQKILRRLFLLPDYQTQYQNELEFLMTIMVSAGSIDLDVLVDTYLAIKSNLDDEEKLFYEKYLRKVHDDLMIKIEKELNERYPQLIGKEDVTPRNKEDMSILMVLKYYSSLSESCMYYRDLMGVSLDQK